LLKTRGISAILSSPIGIQQWEISTLIPTVGYHWKFIGIRPSDPSMIPSPEFRSDFFGWSDPISDSSTAFFDLQDSFLL